jgi:hypothetical protein
MARHTITVNDYNTWVTDNWVQFAASFGEHSNKTFEATFDGRYRVKDHGVVVYRGSNKSTAIAKYNSAE